MKVGAAEFRNYSDALSAKTFPAAFIDLERFDRNLLALAARAKGKPIRIASKSVRSIALLKRALLNPAFQGVLAYRGYEAVHLARAGIQDIVLGYPLVDPVEISAVAKSIQSGAQIVFMCDRIEHLDLLAKAADEVQVDLPFAIDLDLSNRWPGLYFGVRRSWISSPERMSQLLKGVRKYSKLKLIGAMGYEAQIAGVSDRLNLYTFLKNRAAPSVRKKREAFVAQLKAEGFQLRFVNGGGTGSFESTRLDTSVTELCAGSGFFSPTLFDTYKEFCHEAAIFFALQVTRKPEDDIATCASGGYIASGTTEISKQPTPVLPLELSLLQHEGAGEVQTPVQGAGAKGLKIGDLVIFRPAKAGEICERFNELHLISGNKIVETVTTYRGEGKSFG
jgi:D-serine deaminase-like pyridoxal phosphate-dependent protein